MSKKIVIDTETTGFNAKTDELLQVYNTGFDVGFLESNGATFKAEYKVVDVMKLFAPVYGVWSEERNDYKWQKLTTAAEYYGYDWSKRAETAHNSLGDCFATLFVYENINRL